MVTVGMEGHDEEGGVVVEGVVLGDGEEEVFLDILILWTPDLLTAFVDNSVLVRVVGNGGSTGWGSEEMREELGFWGDGEQEVGKDGSRQSRGRDDGDGSFSDGWWEVFYGDVSEGDSLDDFLELEVDVGILLFGGWGVLKLQA
jgi:hypothetical protein